MSDSDSELAKLEALAAQLSDSGEESSSSSSSEEEKPGEDEADISIGVQSPEQDPEKQPSDVNTEGSLYD